MVHHPQKEALKIRDVARHMERHDLPLALVGHLIAAGEHGFSDDDFWDIAAISAFFAMSNRLANFTSLRPNDEFYALGRS